MVTKMQLRSLRWQVCFARFAMRQDGEHTQARVVMNLSKILMLVISEILSLLRAPGLHMLSFIDSLHFSVSLHEYKLLRYFWLPTYFSWQWEQEDETLTSLALNLLRVFHYIPQLSVFLDLIWAGGLCWWYVCFLIALVMELNPLVTTQFHFHDALLLSVITSTANSQCCFNMCALQLLSLCNVYCDPFLSASQS